MVLIILPYFLFWRCLLYLQAIEIDKIALTENHPGIATDLNNLAGLYESQGKYEAAEQLYLQAFEIRKIALPKNHPDTAMTLWHLAVHYENKRIFTSAESFYLKALKIYKQSLGLEHPYTQKVQEYYQNMLNKKNN